MAPIVLSEAIQLGPGRCIRPPLGWKVSGRVAADPLRLQPPSRIIIAPSEQAQASISWRTAGWLIGKPTAEDFRLLLDIERQLQPSALEILYPELIRITPHKLTEARVKRHPGAGRVLAVSYLDADSGFMGYILYAPTTEIDGEVQLLSYEGIEMEYLLHLEAAMASLDSFRDEGLLKAM